MADQASSSITISAAPSEVMAVIADLAAYPEWAGYIKSADVLSADANGRPERATFVLDAGVIKDTYTLGYTWEGDSVCSWTLVKGTALKKQDGSYTLEADGAATKVTYRLTVDLAIPMLGMFKRKAEKVIMDTALKELKKRVEG